jgi:hypothetical protein
MHKQVVSEEIIPPLISNWEYPKLSVNMEGRDNRNHIDLPDSVRYEDCVAAPLKYIQIKGPEIEEFLNNWKPYERKDDCRIVHSYKNGGKVAENTKITQKLRSIGREFIYKVGKHILSGNFNLTTIPFPIKAMVPKSYLEYVGCLPTAYFPLYMNLALKTSDPVERFKLYIVAQISYFYLTTSFAKPLNPIIGETFNGYYEDGSRIFLEQISHHPPVAYMMFTGPNDSYKFYGPSMFSASAGLNSITLNTKAWRRVEFKDNKQTIYNTMPNEYFSGTLLGTTVHETIGSMEYTDVENKIYCKLVFGGVKKKPSDYVDAQIFVDGKPVCSIKGTYLGWLEFDGQRYFDFREMVPFEAKSSQSPIPSDCNYRNDKALLAIGHYNEAQKEKEALEHVQRTDTKLRKAYIAAGGNRGKNAPVAKADDGTGLQSYEEPTEEGNTQPAK